MSIEYVLFTIAAFAFFMASFIPKKEITPAFDLIGTLAGLITGYFAYKIDPDFAPWIIYIYVALFAFGLLFGILEVMVAVLDSHNK